MRSKEVKSELQFLENFASLAEGLQQVSMVKMRDVREYIERSRRFHEGLSEIYRDVKGSVNLNFNRRHSKEEASSIPKKKKSVCVLLSANTRLYGSIVDEVYDAFMRYITRVSDDVVIIGKIGKERYTSETEKRDFVYFDLKDAGIIYLDLLSILGYILNYESITVFYVQFNDIFDQRPIQKSVPGDVLFDTSGMPLEMMPKEQFFLEPSPEELENFFSGQVIGLLFRQAAYEFELSRHASRIQTLEQALDETFFLEKKAHRSLGRLQRNGESNRQAYNIAFSTRRK